MNPERYKRIDQLFQQALSQPPGSRETFLREVCGADEDLRREVESLIEHERRAALWPDSRSRDSGAGVARARPQSNEAREPGLEGRSILHYRLLEKIGEGGMGVVYRAEDTHLRRPVAIKVLPPEKVADPERKRRFIQEARAASALNHPNIVTIHDITSADGIDFIAMEYVAGKPLAELIAGKGLPMREAFKYAIQIADALAKAHRAGIIHRDLKPSNILVTEDDTVKILDFGLAKLTHPEQESASGLSESLTGSGVIVGTAAYMSPEQAEGKAVDERSDIFGFGAVLYEMITGRRAFKGDSNISTLAAVLHGEPEPVSRIAGAVPAEIERIITRCLKKDPDRRFQHFDDVKVGLQDLSDEWMKRRPVAKYWVIAVATAVVAVAIWTYNRFFSIQEESFPPPRIVQVTSPPGTFKSFPSLSPDGKWIAFGGDGEERGNFDIYVKDLTSTGRPTRLTTDPAGDAFPVWSPDGRQLAFSRLSGAAGALYLVSAVGGGERKVADVTAAHLTWSPDGKTIAFAKSTQTPKGLVLAIWSIRLDTLEQKQVVKLVSSSQGDTLPKYSPDGRSLAFVRRLGLVRQALCRVRLADGDQKVVTEYGSPSYGLCWTPDGREILFSSSENAGEIALWRVAAEGGQPQRVPVRGDQTYQPTISGNRLAYVKDDGNWDIYRLKLTGSEASSAPGPSLFSWVSNETGGSVSPDGQRIAFQSDRSGSMEIWVAGIDGADPKQITEMKAPNTGAPSWSPDGRMIVFDSQKSGRNLDVWVVNADGGRPRQLTDDPAEDGCPRWSHNERWIYFYSRRGGSANIWKAPSGGGKATPVTTDGNVFYLFFESSDGRFLYYCPEPGARQKSGVYRISTSGGTSTRILDTGSPRPFFLAENGIYFIHQDDPTSTSGPGPPVLKFHDLVTGRSKILRPVSNDPLFALHSRIWISPDGQWLFCAALMIDSEIMLMENFR